MRKKLLSIILLFTLIGCSTTPPTQLLVNPPPEQETTSVHTSTPVQSQPVDILGSVTATSLAPELGITPQTLLSWQQLPIIPEVSPEMIAVYQRGLALGRDPNRFSKIGDCQNITTYYLAMFDSGNYSLGPDYAYLQPTIDHFKGSWQRESLAVRGGMNVAAVQNILWTNSDECKKGEDPLQCELRVYNPSIAIISMEESWSGAVANYDKYLRKIVEYVLSQDIVPILATRAETPTQERQINAVVAKIAEDYHVPLWNFGAATAKLDNYGISPDGFHLTGKNEEPKVRSFFDIPDNLKFGWTQRNLTALQSIDAVYRGLTGQ